MEKKKARFFLADAELARRARVANTVYQTKDGRVIMSEKDLQRLTFTADEMLNGIPVEEVSREEAHKKIAENGYKLLDSKETKEVQDEQG